MPIGVLLTRWTIRLALALYAAVLLGRITASGDRPRRWDRPLWTTACLIFLVHVACAFGFYHHWRHAEAMENVAYQTRQMLGWEFGAGIYYLHGRPRAIPKDYLAGLGFERQRPDVHQGRI